MIKISKDELFNYELPAWWNKKRIEDEEITTMRKLIGRKDFTVDVICEHLRVATSCWEEYIKSLCEVNKMLLAGINVSEIIVLLQDNKYSSYGGENYMYSQLEIEAYEKLISKYCTNPVIITDINIIVPNKVVEVTFADGKKEKMVCHEEDTFNLRNCLFIAIAKHLYKKDYTFEGIEWKAFELTHLKKYAKIVDSALKAYDKKQKEIKKEEEGCKAEKERIERRRAKKQAYKERRVAKREQEERDKQIAIQREAYLQAMDIIKGEK